MNTQKKVCRVAFWGFQEKYAAEATLARFGRERRSAVKCRHPEVPTSACDVHVDYKTLKGRLHFYWLQSCMEAEVLDPTNLEAWLVFNPYKNPFEEVRHTSNIKS